MKRTRAILASVLTLPLFVAACGGSGGSGGSGPIKVGVITPLTGSAAQYGTGFADGVHMAVDEINGKGGINVNGTRHKIDLTVCDDEFVPSKSLQCGHKLSDSLLVYTPATQSAFPLMGFNAKDGFILMSTSQTHDFTAQGNPLVVRATYDLKRQIPQLVPLLKSYAKKEGKSLQKIAVMKVDSDFGSSFIQYFNPAWKAAGGTITGTASYDTNSTDFTKQLTSILRAHPDAIALTTVCQTSALVAKQARQLGFNGVFIDAVCPGGEGLTKYLDPSQVGSYVSLVKQNAYPTIPVVASFDKKYEKKYGHPITAPIPAFGYFGIKWFAKAVQIAGTTTDADKVHTALKKALEQLPQPNLIGVKSYDPGTGNIKMAAYLGVTKPNGDLVNPLPVDK